MRGSGAIALDGCSFIGSALHTSRNSRADLLLQHEPGNMQARSLRSLIDNAVTRDGYIGKLGES
jgi:hypothetical protein